MRIVAGTLGGRVFISTARATHPMSEKMRGAIFNSLGDIEGLSVLDAFSGSGAISFEAVSRGATSSLAIESNKTAQADIAKNIKTLGLSSKVRLIKAALGGWLDTSTDTDNHFDIIIADPPYDDLHLTSVKRLSSRLNIGGTLVLSLPPKIELTENSGLKLIRQKKYGDGQLVFYKNNQ